MCRERNHEGSSGEGAGVRLTLCIFACLALSAAGHSAGIFASQLCDLGSCGGQSKAVLPRTGQPDLRSAFDSRDRAYRLSSRLCDRVNFDEAVGRTSHCTLGVAPLQIWAEQFFGDTFEFRHRTDLAKAQQNWECSWLMSKRNFVCVAVLRPRTSQRDLLNTYNPFCSHDCHGSTKIAEVQS